MTRLLILLAALLSFFLLAETALAQSLGTQSDPVQFLVAPDSPAPGDTILIEVQGVGDFLGGATITWQIDGKTVQSGLSERTLSFTAGPLGSKTSVHVILSSSGHTTVTHDFIFNPSLVNMVWEAHTSVPPWYLGKALYTAGSTLTVTAFPQVIVKGASVAPSNLSFKWSRNDTPLPQSSGAGRNQITFQGSQLFAGETVSVDVLTGGTVVAHGEITIPAQKPQLLLYEKDPLRGVLYDRALSGSVSLSTTEFTVQAVPYYFANSSITNGTAPFVWKLNDKDSTGPETAQGTLTLRQAGSGAGSASLEVAVQNLDSDKYVQNAKTAVQILFGGASASSFSSFFGL